jgi:uncharacterized protein
MMDLMVKYRIDLASYMQTCDDNYRRLLKLVPALESARTIDGAQGSVQGQYWEFVAGSLRANNKMIVRIRLLEYSKYTSTVAITVSQGFPQWTPSPSMSVRLYHDAATAEPLSYQGHSQIPVRNPQPNADMYQQDEKRQVNEFLAEWLSWCLGPGVRARSSDILCVD